MKLNKFNSLLFIQAAIENDRFIPIKAIIILIILLSVSINRASENMNVSKRNKRIDGFPILAGKVL